MLKNLTASAVDADVGLIPGSERFSWRRKWLPTPVFLPGKFHGQRGLAEYSPWGRTELDATDVILVPGAFVSTPSPGDLCAPETCLSWTGPGLCGQGRPGRGGAEEAELELTLPRAPAWFSLRASFGIQGNKPNRLRRKEE